jgi:hypothetical protein
MTKGLIDLKPIEFKHLQKRKYRNKDPRVPQHPHHVLACGPTGSGKTTVLMNILFDGLTAIDRVVIIAKRLDQEIWQEVILRFEELAEENEVPVDAILRVFTGEGSEIPTVDEMKKILGDDPNTEKQTMIIFDDYMKDAKANKVIEEYYSQIRHFNASCWYLAQSYYDTPKFIRDNVQYILLFKGQTVKDLGFLYRDLSDGKISKERFIGLYNEVTSQPHHFLFVDRLAQTDKTRYRDNFDGIIL